MTDRDGRTDGFVVVYTALAKLALRRAVKIIYGLGSIPDPAGGGKPHSLRPVDGWEEEPFSPLDLVFSSLQILATAPRSRMTTSSEDVRHFPLTLVGTCVPVCAT